MGEALAKLLRDGRRKDAAALADHWAVLGGRVAGDDDAERARTLLRDMSGCLAVLAQELRDVGDRHARRGRPAARTSSELSARFEDPRRQMRELRIAQMMSTYRLAVLARCVADSDMLGRDALGELLRRYGRVKRLSLSWGDLDEGEAPADARERRAMLVELQPLAKALLRELRLGRVDRRGFRAAYWLRIVASHRIDGAMPKRPKVETRR